MSPLWDLQMLAKEVVKILLSKAGQHKDVVWKVFASEVSRFLQHINVAEELRRALSGLEIDVSAQIKIKDKTNINHKPTPAKRVHRKKKGS